ncbi:MAG TPA: class I SAM-dependent methyltransferase [Dehalococcoidia bacterium]|nr:class I SAM-dependent methyltransferase [Dehalococcoidia bacterium]
MTKRSFDSNKYWQDRHDKFLDNSQGVGNISYSQDENDQIYINARRRLGQVLDAMKLPGDRTALDLGCGIGLMATPFLERGINYFGMDISATAIELATESYPEASFLCGDITSLGNPPR